MFKSISFQPTHIQSITVSMSLEGWWTQRNQFPRLPGIYVVFCTFEDKKYVLRVGIACGKRGIYGRWFHSLGAHYHIWKTQQPPTEGYHDFYTQIAGLCDQIEIHFLLYPHCTSKQIQWVEKELIHRLIPIWESRWIDGMPAFKEHFFIMRKKDTNTKPCLRTMLKKTSRMGGRLAPTGRCVPSHFTQ